MHIQKRFLSKAANRWGREQSKPTIINGASTENVAQKVLLGQVP